MSRAFLGALLLILSAGLAPGQSAEPPAPIFPSDGKPPTEANGAELLQAVCPGRVQVGEEIGCGKECPSFAGLKELVPWSLITVMLGHFLSPTSNDAVLFMQGCEAGNKNFGGTILLSQGFQGWAIVWYKAGVETSQCHKVPLQTAREILVCIGTTGVAGSLVTELYVEDLLNPGATLRAEDETPFLAARNNVVACGENFEDETKPFPLTRAFIEKVEFPTMPPGEAGSTISVTASFGRRSIAPQMVQACINSPGVFLPPVTSYHLDFVFDGHDYKPTAASAETARLFESR
jgi:hypothetical protein